MIRNKRFPECAIKRVLTEKNLPRRDKIFLISIHTSSDGSKEYDAFYGI